VGSVFEPNRPSSTSLAARCPSRWEGRLPTRSIEGFLKDRPRILRPFTFPRAVPGRSLKLMINRPEIPPR
jgi:hypothetical protein